MADLVGGFRSRRRRWRGCRGGPSGGAGPQVTLVDWDPEAEVKVVTAMLYPYSHLSEEELAAPGARPCPCRNAWRSWASTPESGSTAATARGGRWSGAATVST